MVLIICIQLFKKQTIYGGRVVENNEMQGDVPVSDMRHAFRGRKRCIDFLDFFQIA